MRHTLYQIIWLLTIVVGLGACSTDEEDLLPLDESSIDTPEGDIPIVFHTNLPTASNTRAGIYDSQPDPYVQTIQMLCFDRYGLYVGRRMATPVTPDKTTPDKGTFKGTVPEVTARIHFIGNLELTLGSSFLGEDENVLMRSEAITTHVSSTPTMVYWGYHREETPEALKDWLNPTSETQTHKVYFIHDRATVKLALNSDNSVKVNDDNIEEIQSWTLSNIRQRGLIAPFNEATANTDPFTAYYIGGVASPVQTDFGGARYNATTNDMRNATVPLYLFDDINATGDNAANTVKVILKVKYKQSMVGDIGNGNVRYQVVLLQDKNKEQLHVTRNHTYTITIDRLPFDLGHLTLAEAVAATSFSNGQMVSVAEDVSQITNGKVVMNLNNGKTSIIYQDPLVAGTTIEIPFTFEDNTTHAAPYTLDDNGNETSTQMTVNNFKVSCDYNNGALSTSATDLKIKSYDSSNGKGVISMKIGTVSTSDLAEAKVVISDNVYGMSRTLNVYTITAFAITDATLTRVTGVSRTILGKNCPTYKLSFKLPYNYPEGLFPITIKLASSTLNPFSDNDNRSPIPFGVVVESTGELNSSPTSNAWNYNASNWGYWYTHEIASRPSGLSDNDDIPISIYLDDVRPMRETSAAQVGLYLQIEFFGGITSYTASSN